MSLIVRPQKSEELTVSMRGMTQNPWWLVPKTESALRLGKNGRNKPVKTVSVLCVIWVGLGTLPNRAPQWKWGLPPPPEQMQREFAAGLLSVYEERLCQLIYFRQQYEELAREQPDNPLITAEIARKRQEEEKTRRVIAVLKQGKLPSVQELRD